jgi:uncharacterized protein YuzE
MELHYFPDTDSLYIGFNEKASYEGEEVAPGFVFHFDKEGGIVSIDIDSNASKLVDLSRIELIGMPSITTPDAANNSVSFSGA